MKYCRKVVIITLIFAVINILNIFNEVNVEAVSELPNRYSLAEHYNIKVENQGQEGNCWTFGSLETLETYLQIHGYGTYDFSENHLNYIESNLFSETSAERDINTAGTYENFMEYVNNKYGPVLEKDFPYYEEGTTNYKKYSPSEYKSLLEVTPVAYVSKYKKFPMIDKEFNEYSESELLEFRNSVKKHIMENGAVCTMIIAPSYYINTYYNAETYSAYFPNSSDPSFGEYNHVVAIIGWDDNFSRENFIEENRPEHDGAYIILNSWGKEFGDNGIYYISYDDVYVEKELYGIEEAVIEHSEIKNTKTFEIKDTNLYKALKQKIGTKAEFYDDKNQTITMINERISEVLELDLSESNITDLSGIENLENLISIDLSNNNISSIEPLTKLPNIYSLKLQNNKFTKIPAELSNMSLDKLILNYNPIDNFEKLKNIKRVGNLELEGTNFSDEDLELIVDLDINNLNLAKTNTKDYSILKTLELQSLNISYNRDIVYESIPSVMILNISHTETTDEQLKKIEDISYINSIDISYTNIKDLSILPGSLRSVDISGNKNLENFDNLKYVSSIIYKDAEIEDVTIFKDFMVSQLNLANNNITDYESLLENENLYLIDLSNNKLTELNSSYSVMIIADENNISPVYVFNDGVESLKKQIYSEKLVVDISRDNVFTNVISMLKGLYMAGYNLKFTNASIDYEEDIFKINNLDEDVVIEITNGKLEGSKIIYEIEKVDTSDISYIYVDSSNAKTKYIEGENFDSSKLKVYAMYDNESIEEITDYEIIDGENLQVGINTVTIKKDEFTDYIDVEGISKDDVLTLKFESEEIYDAVLAKVKQIENERNKYSAYFSRLDVLIEKDVEKRTITIYKEDLEDITYIEIISDESTIPLNDIKQLTGLNAIGLNGKNFDDLSVLKNLSSDGKLIDLEIKNNEKLTGINDNIFKSLAIENSQIKNINNLSNLFSFNYNGQQIPEMEQLLDSLQIINVNVNTNIADVDRDESYNIILPEIFKTFYDKGFEVNVRVMDQIRDEQYLNPYNNHAIFVEEKDGKLILDYEQLKEIDYEGNKQFIEISVIDTNNQYMQFNFKYNMKYKLFEKIELSENTPVIDIEDGDVPDLSDLIVYKVYSNQEKEQISDFIYSKEAVTEATKAIKISYSEDGITSTIEVPIKVKEHIHEWGEWTVTKEPTETEEGQRERVCLKNDKHKQIERINIIQLEDTKKNEEANEKEKINISQLEDTKESDETNENKAQKVNSPKTGDNIVDIFVIFVIATVGAFITIKFNRNQKVRKH